MNRRAFLASATATLPASALAAPPNSRPSAIVFYDRRYATSRRLAAQRAREGAAACAVQPDVLAVWRALGPVLSQGRLRVEGLTTHSDFTVLQDCARNAGLKLTHCEMRDGRRRSEATLFSWRFE